MNKTKLLFINGHLNTGGVEKALLDILRHLDYDRFEVDLLLTEELGDYAAQVPQTVNVILRSLKGTYGSFWQVIRNGIRNRDWFSLKMKIIFLLMRFFGMGRLSLAKKMLTGNREYDCVIGFRSGICTQIASYATNANRRITWWHHGEINVDIKKYLNEVENCNKIVAVSDSCRNMLIQAMPTLSNRLVMIPNMVDVSAILQRATIFDPPYAKNGFHIVSVGRMAQEKHFDNAIYAARKLRDEGIDFKWHLVGDGVMRGQWEQLARDLAVEDVIVFEGNQENPYPYMLHADLFVHPSYVESFGIVVVEALALGRPCVVTKSAGVMDFLTDGKNALLTEQNSQDLTAKVVQAVKDSSLREQLRTNAHCSAEVNPQTVINKIAAVLL